MSSSNADTLNDVARRMFDAGRLPGIRWRNGVPCNEAAPCNDASDGDLMHAAIQHAMSRGWYVHFDGAEESPGVTVSGWYAVGGVWKQTAATEPGTTALSVLLAVERACEASEGGAG